MGDVMKPVLAALLVASAVPVRAQAPAVAVECTTSMRWERARRHQPGGRRRAPTRGVRRGDPGASDRGGHAAFHGQAAGCGDRPDYFGARYYSNWTGGFTTVDPARSGVALLDPGSGTGAYAGTNGIDPTAVN